MAETQKQHSGATIEAAERIRRVANDLADLGQHVEATRSRLAEVVVSFTAAEDRIWRFEATLQEKASNDSFSQLESRLPEIEQAVRDGQERARRFEGALAGIEKHGVNIEQAMREKVSFTQIKQFENVVTGMQSQILNIDQALYETASGGQLTKLRVELGEMEAKFSDFEAGLHDKVGATQLQQVKAALMGIETKSVEQIVQEKVSTSTITQIKCIIMSVQTQIVGMEQGIKEKVGGDQLQHFKNSSAAQQAQITGLEQALHDKIGFGHFQQVKNAMSAVDSKMGALEQSLQEKFANFNGQDLSDAVHGLQSKLSGLERSIWEGTDVVQQLESHISSLKAQVSSVEQGFVERVTTQHLQLVDRVLAMASRAASLERQLSLGAERTQSLEEAVGGLHATLNSFRHALGNTAVRADPARHERISGQSWPLQIQDELAATSPASSLALVCNECICFTDLLRGPPEQ